MKKIALLAFVLVLLLYMTIFIYFSVPAKAENKTWTVDDDGPADFQTIQEAINAASPSDTVFVNNGIYQEWNIALAKDHLSLVGENKDNTVIDGMNYGWILIITAQNVTVTGFTIQRSSIGTAGVFLDHAIESEISNNIIRNHDSGIYSIFSNGNVIENNRVSESYAGVVLSRACRENRISNNDVTGNTRGIDLSHHAHHNEIRNNNIDHNKYGVSISYDNNSICGNQIENNDVGIYKDLLIGPAQGYRIFHNNFINNTKQIDVGNQSVNTWDNGLEGNYWSNYTGVDSDHDGIGDTTHEIDADNVDNYPLMGVFSDINATSEHNVQTICNSSISYFQFNGTAICFNVTGENGTTGFCRICVPTALINETYKVFVGGIEVPCNLLPCSNSTHSYLYFTYNHSTEEVIIIPQFPTWTSTLLILMILTVAVSLYKRILLKTPIH